VLAVLAIPHTRFQWLFKALAWTAIVFGVYAPYVWPHVCDLLSRIAFLGLVVLHISVVSLTYSRLPGDGFIAIGMIAVVELLVFSIPGGWIIVRSRDKRKISH
jgi:predicted membrane channel-forming protein YqfA (hemolysin III family)